jgi:hypothetical protein
VTYLLTAEQVTQETKKPGGMFGKLSKALGGSQLELRYTVVAVNDGRELLRSSAVAKSNGAGFAAALGVAQTAMPLAGAGSGGRVAQGVVQSAALAAANNPMAGMPVAGLLGQHSSAAYSGMMDPNLHSLAYMGRYAPEVAGAHAAGMAVNAAAKSAASDASKRATVDAVPEGPLDGAMSQAARAVRERLSRER